jgi:3-oxoacyl-[acyl-carrier protein] reductase
VTKLALVTGASRGIGKSVAQTLAQHGYQVIGTATTESGANLISEYLADYGEGHCGRVLDISNAAQLQEEINFIVKKYGTPYVLVNNAGITRDNLFMRMSESQWDDVIDTNLTGTFRVCKALIKPLIKAKIGRIINISSVVASTGNAGQTNYSAAKAGLEGFTRSLAQEISSRNITVNSVAPGFIETDMTNVLSPDQKASILSSIPMKRMGTTQEISGTVVFLASDNAAYITGQTIHVNGGMNMG